MAHQQAYQAYPQNKGTLIPGQTIAVNNYTVQVERYLSQGGFAHVYLVRTPQPVYNTTHHVLKRIAVANEAMLTDVKKEVDIMRLLKGHPNIVHLIDASWHKLPNGTFEVFILMEFCPGGGIIDMMNRRLRERLTEAEILQIFVDVCEGVAYMHNSRPPLLHRDLKVENILQSTPTSFKLCDFGSATTVSNPATNMQEIRAVEADLNRHTTLQYRAPEMVDVYSKRPINEKSDVWALGVLLYKLCYYTTPFEEHGPLAILNVQYRIPPYPVYSQDMNMLIASMLREHGAQRPTVFELLNHVHRLRGTRSKFSYNIPPPLPASSRSQGHGKIAPLPSPNPMDGVITFSSSPSAVGNTMPANQGVQARDRVLEAIAPMRRGRPAASKEQNSISSPSSPEGFNQVRTTNQEKSQEPSYTDFTVEQERAWKVATERSAVPASHVNADDATWNLDKPGNDTRRAQKSRPAGFGDDFAESLWTAPDPNHQPHLRPRLSPSPNKVAMSVQRSADASITPSVFTGGSRIRPKQDRLIPARDTRDAFDGLGLMTNAPKTAPTLGEARKLRTGLAIMSTSSGAPQGDYVRDSERRNPQRPTPSPQLQPRYLSATPLIPQSISPIPTPGSSNNMSYRSSNSPSSSVAGPPSATNDGAAIEARFPSLEELDAQFSPIPPNPLYPSSIYDASSSQMFRQTTNRSQHSARTPNIGASGTGGNYLKPAMSATMSYALDGTRSQQVTGIAMRDAKDGKRFPDANAGANWTTSPTAEKDNALESNLSNRDRVVQPKPLVVRKRRSSTKINPSFSSGTTRASETPGTQSNFANSSDNSIPPKLPARPAPSSSSRDWLTGDDQENEEIKPHLTPEVPVIRDSPSKRASFIENSEFRIISGSVAQHVIPSKQKIDEPPPKDLSPTVSKFNRAFPVLDLEPFDADKLQFSFSPQKTDSQNTAKKDVDVDSSSADEEGPEEPNISTTAQKRQNARAKGRQSSVHDLVYQYGGGLISKEKDKDNQKDVDKERPMPTVQYNVSASDYTPRKSRPTAPGLAPPTMQRPTPTTPSPTSATAQSSPSFGYKQLPNLPTTTDRSQPPPLASKPVLSNNGIKSPPSSRSRPQSMFIFPSKSSDSSAVLSPNPSTNNLVPPPDSKPRAIRRTSISDMVQLYESIGTTSKQAVPLSLPPPSPAPVQKPVVGRSNLTSMENPRALKTSDTGRAFSSKAPLSSSTSTYSDYGRSRTPAQSKEPIRKADTSTPSKFHRKPISDRDTPVPDDATPRPKRMSVRGPSLTTLPSRADSLVPHRTTKPPVAVNSSARSDSPKKPAIPLPEETASIDATPGEDPPERPYQGVGRLIDQWQKKSAEADQSRPIPGKLARRTGIIQGDDR